MLLPSKTTLTEKKSFKGEHQFIYHTRLFTWCPKKLLKCVLSKAIKIDWHLVFFLHWMKMD